MIAVISVVATVCVPTVVTAVAIVVAILTVVIHIVTSVVIFVVLRIILLFKSLKTFYAPSTYNSHYTLFVTCLHFAAYPRVVFEGTLFAKWKVVPLTTKTILFVGSDDK